MTNQQAPEIYTLHTVLNKGERPWSGIYGVRADAEHDAKVMRDVTGRDWSVVRLVVADTAATPTGPITRYEVVDCIDSKHVPAIIPNGAGPWVRYEDHIAALVEAQQPTTHVQNPAEIEHVAGDVSKNGPGSNRAQQPAPSAAAADPCPGCIPGGYCRTPKCGRLAALNAAPRANSAPVAAAPFQERVQPWLLECFGAEIAADRVERNHRFLEESLELVQSLGCTASEAHQLVDYVFGRPVGDPPQEVGGVMVTLAALCLASGLDMHDAGEVELTRISAPEVVAKIRAKQAAKPKHSPLPQSPRPRQIASQR